MICVNCSKPTSLSTCAPGCYGCNADKQAQQDQPGRKADTGKIRVDLLPVDVLEEVSKVLTHGAKKYEDRNWEKGISYNRCYGALLRHVWAWWRKEDKDPETGLSHLSHAICNLMFLLAYELRGKGKDYDNRP